MCALDTNSGGRRRCHCRLHATLRTGHAGARRRIPVRLRRAPMRRGLHNEESKSSSARRERAAMPSPIRTVTHTASPLSYRNTTGPRLTPLENETGSAANRAGRRTQDSERNIDTLNQQLRTAGERRLTLSFRGATLALHRHKRTYIRAAVAKLHIKRAKDIQEAATACGVRTPAPQAQHMLSYLLRGSKSYDNLGIHVRHTSTLTIPHVRLR